MKAYVIEEFTRDDEICEHDSKVIDVYANECRAIEKAKEHAIKYLDYYKYMRVDEPNKNLKYCCCLDADPNNEAEYPKYMIITVTEHEIKDI